VDRYRQSVLKAAVTGELTRDWREEHAYQPESGQALLTRILEARRDSWLKHQQVSMSARGKHFDECLTRKYSSPSQFAFGETSTLPSHWAQCSIEAITSAERPIAYGVLQPGEERPGGIRMIRVCDIAEGKVDESSLKTISPHIAAQFPRTELRGGEVLLTIVGTIGRSAIASASIKGANVARAVAVLVPTGMVLPEWLETYFSYQRTRQLLTDNAREVARKTLNLEQLRELAIPVPPIPEQQRLLSALETALSKADAAERMLEVENRRMLALRQSILRSAFSGQLVPQDPKDEPVSVLLARIAAERATAAPKPRAPKQPRRKRAKA
jgi:type I restriction enzyme, S subunit